MPFLRQNTAQTIRFGPCLDKTDGVTEETGLTLAQADMRLSKDGGAFAQKSAAGNATHDSDGWYSTALSTTDTDTVGELILNVHQPANMLPVWLRWWVLEEKVYDDLFGAAATGMRGTDSAALASVCTEARLAELAAANLPSDVDAILADSSELQGDWVNGGRLDLLLDAIPTTAMRGTDGANTATPLTAAQVLTEINTALDAAISELAQGVPTATPSIRTGIMLGYMALRNKLDVATSATDTLEVHNDAGTRIAQKLLTDDGSDYSEAKMTSGA